MNNVLEVSRLHKTYGGAHGTSVVAALKDVSFAVGAGEFVSVMGPSGSGKTTLLNLLAGLDTPSSGEILINGQSYTVVDGEKLAVFRRRHLGFVFQDYNLLDTLTLHENVALPLLLDKRDDRTRVHQTLALLGIDALADRFPYQVSGGQQQRAAVARAIVHQPTVVLADEPTGNLDSASAKTLLQHFTTLNQQMRVTLLMVTHDPQAASYAHRVIFLKDGSVCATLVRGTQEARTFFTSLLDTLSALEGA